MRKSEKGFASFMSSRRDARRGRVEFGVAAGISSWLVTVAAAVVALRDGTMHCRAIDFSIGTGKDPRGRITRVIEAGDGIFCSKGAKREMKTTRRLVNTVIYA